MRSFALVAYFGVRYLVSDVSIQSLEERTHPIFGLARKVNLNVYWGDFADNGNRNCLLFGSQLAILGPENESEFNISEAKLVALMSETAAKLKAAAVADEPKLYLQWLPAS